MSAVDAPLPPQQDLHPFRGMFEKLAAYQAQEPPRAKLECKACGTTYNPRQSRFGECRVHGPVIAEPDATAIMHAAYEHGTLFYADTVFPFSSQIISDDVGNQITRCCHKCVGEPGCWVGIHNQFGFMYPKFDNPLFLLPPYVYVGPCDYSAFHGAALVAYRSAPSYRPYVQKIDHIFGQVIDGQKQVDLSEALVHLGTIYEQGEQRDLNQEIFRRLATLPTTHLMSKIVTDKFIEILPIFQNQFRPVDPFKPISPFV